MDKRNLIYFKNRLDKELGQLLRGTDCNLDGLNDSEENLPDLIDRASSFIDRSPAQNILCR
jgi:RNA polymerase-binding transcription factor DksA